MDLSALTFWGLVIWVIFVAFVGFDVGLSIWGCGIVVLRFGWFENAGRCGLSVVCGVF